MKASLLTAKAMTRPRRIQAPKRRALPSGTVGVIGMDTGRFSEFSMALARLKLPDGWMIQGAFNYDEAHARNALVESFAGEYLFFMDDDHAFAPKTLERLLAHGLDVVAPLCLQRRAPFVPTAIKGGHHLELAPTKPYTEGRVMLVTPDPPGLYEVDLTGTAGMLVRRSVFDKLERPYFHHGDDADGTHRPSDTNFCKALTAAGVPIYVDTAVTLTHFNVAGFTPRWDGRRWVRSISVANEEVARF